MNSANRVILSYFDTQNTITIKEFKILLLFILRLTKLMPRRIPDYADAYAGWNLVSSWKSAISEIATLVWCYLLYDMFVKDKNVNETPWEITPFFTINYHEDETITAYEETLEWMLRSPTSFHSYNMLPATS